MDEQAKQTPLAELLDAVPEDVRIGIQDGEDWNAGTTWHPVGRLCHEAAAELRRLHVVNQELLEAAQLCDKHAPDGGTVAACVICSGQKLSHALSRISYLCEPPNEMECSSYDLHYNEDAVVAQVERLHAVNQELLEALRRIATVNAMDYEYQAWARAAIAKAEGEKT